MTQQGYPPGPGPYQQFPGFPGIPQQGQPAAPGAPPPAPPYPGQPAPGYPPPPQAAPPGYGPPPGAYPPAPGQAPMVQVPPPGSYPPAPGGYPPPGYPPQGNPYAQPGAPPQGYPGAPGGWGQPQQPQGFHAPAGRLNGQMMQGVDPAGARHPFMTCIDAQRVSQWVLEVALTKQANRSGAFVVECIVHWTDYPGVEPRSMRSWVQSMTDKDMALPSIKRFVLAALGFDSEPHAFGAGFTQQHFDHLYTAICDDENHLVDPQTRQPLMFGPNPLKGQMVNCVVNPPGNGLNKKGQPKVYQRHDFSPKR